MVEFRGNCDEPGIYCVYLRDEDKGNLTDNLETTAFSYVFAKSGNDAFMEVLRNREKYGYDLNISICPVHCGVDRVTSEIPREYEGKLFELLTKKS